MNEQDRRQHEETIEAVKPGFGAAVPGQPARRRGFRLPLAGVAVLVLLVLAGIVFFALPGWVEERTARGVVETPASPAPAPAAPAAEPAPSLSAEELAALQARAESQLADLLQQRSRLEARSAQTFGGAEWARYEELSRAGDEALLDEDYASAVTHYTAALEAGAALLARAEQIIATALATAANALAAGNARLALEQYDVVLGIEPENAAALSGRARAERLPEVLALLQRAEQARQRRALEEAAEHYRAALEIDPDWSPAREALAGVTDAIEAARLESHLSRGYAALADEEYADAQTHFRAALGLDPASRAAVDGLAQAEQGEKLEAIALAEARALAFERRELWGRAIDLYQEALAADASVAFALEGLTRARARADLDRKLQNLIDNPNLLLTDRILADARPLADEARALAEPETRIGSQVSKLDELIGVASTPVTVELQSDEVTEVAVYRVGALGAFATKEIQVRPGTYTAVGSRDGYRDVRETFTVWPGRAPPVIRIACSEPIR